MGMKIIPVSDLRRSVSQIIKGLLQEDDTVYITQHGRPQAVLVSYDHYENLLAQVQEQSAVTDRLQLQDDSELVELVTVKKVSHV